MSKLLWNEQRQAVMVAMRTENQMVMGEDVKETEGIETESLETGKAPEDLADWQQSLSEQDADLLAEIDRENEALRQQAALLQQQTGQQELQAGQQTDGIQTLSLPYTQEQLGSLTFLKEHLYNVNGGAKVTAGLLDTQKLLAMDMGLQQPDSGGPKVLIHHTHATEYFADSDPKDESTLIVGVGDYLEELLETRYGIQVIHDRTVYPYNEAYSQALKHVGAILAENPTIEVFIDLHRDAGGTKKYTVNVDGKETAHLMFFNGLSHNSKGPIEYLPNENQQANLAFSFQMKMAGDSLYPGLCKRNYLKAYRYNLHVLPRAVIVEVGDHRNTLQEAKNAMEPLARILHLILMGER
ncbi:MAG: stage II sporulation protein P [Lachnospiraceae bacterium]|nr:stage II sporulation protein P [Lachnospiraceae bacterium]